MKAEVMATIVGGLLKPDERLSFPDQSRVKLTIETIGAEPDAVSAWKAFKARLAQRPASSLATSFDLRSSFFPFALG